MSDYPTCATCEIEVCPLYEGNGTNMNTVYCTDHEAMEGEILEGFPVIGCPRPGR
ncbi:MAG: hypothetical protein GY847_14350 [Proteobacteria bacterium]|nr:hypothetical protein [Pseudomonadota bacterium]